jgi:uncharacterized protein (TIGR02594 family)
MYTQPWMTVANDYLGLLEAGGAANNQKILDFATIVGGDVAKEYIADSIPWCGLFVGFVMAQTGIVPVDGMLWALNWAKYGKKLTEPAFGCIAAFKRDGGGHVGFVVGHDSTHYHILGGNQGDSVSITPVLKSRCKGLRWPPGMDKFLVPGLSRSVYTGKVTTKEA